MLEVAAWLRSLRPSARHGLTVRERDEAAHVAIDVPDPGSRTDYETDQEERRDDADHDPHERPPERADHPAMMARERLAELIEPHVVEDEPDEAGEADRGPDEMQDVGDQDDCAFGLH